eukprot:2122521-Prorocentrum_lima.AAC.1
MAPPASQAKENPATAEEQPMSEIGGHDPGGFLDPAGITAEDSVENFKRRDQTEIKQGHLSMLSAMGYITPEITSDLPAYPNASMSLKVADGPNAVPAEGSGQILTCMALCEMPQSQGAETAAAGGNFGFKV